MKPISGQMGVFRLTEQDWCTLAMSHLSYIGQSVSVAHRWATYIQSGLDHRKHKNCLDRTNLRGNRVLMRLLDWGICDKNTLDISERCQIALFKPPLNRVTYNYDKSYCQLPIKRCRGLQRQSGIYQLIVVPIKTVKDIPMKVVSLPDIISWLDLDLRANPERLKGYVPLKALKFYDFT